MAVDEFTSIGRRDPCFRAFQQDNALRPFCRAERCFLTIFQRNVGEDATEFAEMWCHDVSQMYRLKQVIWSILEGCQSVSVQYRGHSAIKNVQDSLPHRWPGTCTWPNGKASHAALV